MMRHNRPLVLLCAATLLFLSGMFSLQTVAVYYARDVLGNAELLHRADRRVDRRHDPRLGARPQGGRDGRQEAHLPRGRRDRRRQRRGVRRGARVGPGDRIVCYGVLGIGLGAINTLIFALQADTVDYGEWNSGIRAEGGSYSVLSFTRKTGQGIGGAVAAYTIGLGGYVSGAASQTGSALTSIRVAAGIIPAAFILAGNGRHAGLPADREGLPRHHR